MATKVNLNGINEIDLTLPGTTTVSVSAGVQSIINSGFNGVNKQTGTTYTFLSSDNQKLVSFSNASPIAATLPTAGSAGFDSNFIVWVSNIGAGNLTITPVSGTIDGAANLVLYNGQGAVLFNDGANWFTSSKSGSPGGGNTDVQFNDNGVFGGNSSFTFDKSTGLFTAPELVINGVASGTAASVNTGNMANKGIVVKASSNIPAPIIPSSVTSATLVGWYKADALGLADGSPVTTWTDSSGLGHDLSSLATAPIFKTNIVNGNPVVRFAGASKLQASFTLAQPNYVFIVYKKAIGYSGGVIADGVTLDTQLFYISDATHIKCYAGSYATVVLPIVDNGAFHIISANFNGTLSNESQDNNLLSSGTVGTNSPNGLTVGCEALSSFKYTGDIAEFIQFNGTIASDDIIGVYSYLSAKYNININVNYSSNFQEWQKSDGTVLTYIANDGSINSPNLTINSSGLIKFAVDTGISRYAAGVIAIGTGAAGNASGTVKAAAYISPIINVSTTYTAVAGNIILCTTTSAPFTVTLPLAANNIGATIIVKKITNDVNAVTVGVSGSDTIDGSSTQIITTYNASATLVAGAAGLWYLI